MRAHTRLILSAAALLVASCTPASGLLVVEDGIGAHQVQQLPIYGGDAPDAPEHDAVVALHQLQGSSVYVSPFCSGTLVTEDVVVTAAHCLDTANGGPKFKTMNAGALAVYVGDDPSVDLVQNLYIVSETLIHAAYNRRQLIDDIAILRLASPVTGVVPVDHLPGSLAIDGSDIGALINFAGFGQDEFGGSGVKLQVDGVLGGLGCSVPGCSGADDPNTQISYAQATAGPCFGDSGGPAFFYDAGVPYLAGVTSYGDSYCTQYGVSTKVDAYEAWIDAFVSPPPPPDCSADGACNPLCAAGADPDCGGSGGSCGDGTCGAGESCDGRAGTASCSADCAGRTNGKPARRYCYVEGVCEGPGCP